VLRYFGPKLPFRGSETINATYFETKRILSAETILTDPGLAVVRNEEFFERGRLIFGSATSPQGPEFPSTPENVRTLERVVGSGNKVYTSGGSALLWEPS
jgi:hypothetical protein